MKRSKYYFEDKDSEICYSLDYFIEKANPEETELTLYPAMIMYGEPFFWCRKLQECGEVGEGWCGKECKDYSPRNGKSGRCRFSANCYEAADRPVIIKLKGGE